MSALNARGVDAGVMPAIAARHRARSWVLALASVALCWLGALGSVPAAHAAIEGPQTIDGPSASILDVDGAAMAPDGTGGIVYRKVGSDGLAHVYVAKFDKGSWSAPIQVDTGQDYPASEPVIGAADGGRLLVAWVEPYATIDGSVVDELRSAYMGPGADGFGQAIDIDPTNVGTGADVSPDIAMAPNGTAYIVYRVVTNTLLGNGTVIPIEPMRAGDELVDIRVARFNGTAWSYIGAVNRALNEVTMRRPSAANAPVIGTDAQGNAVVAWQEPDASGVARIWARRIFGASLGNALPVSPASVDGVGVDVDADAPAIATGQDGSAAVAFRLSGGTGSPFATTQIMIASLPSRDDAISLGEDATQFGSPFTVGNGASLGVPSIALDQQNYIGAAYRVADDNGGSAQVTGDVGGTLAAPATYGQAAGDPVLTTAFDSTGGAVVAWSGAGAGGLPALAVREDFGDGGQQTAALEAPLAGTLDGVELGSSGTGDALLAFRQGPSDREYVEGAYVQAPPDRITLIQSSPNSSWVRRGQIATIGWIPWSTQSDWDPGLRYSVYLDGRQVASDLTATSFGVPTTGLDSGEHQVTVVATDSLGQRTVGSPLELDFDVTAPTVTVSTGSRRTVKLRVKDGFSGVDGAATRISWGDRRHTNRKASTTHTYKRDGTYTLTVVVEDSAGNRATLHPRVVIGAKPAARQAKHVKKSKHTKKAKRAKATKSARVAKAKARAGKSARKRVSR